MLAGLTNVTFEFGSRALMQDATWHIQPGERIGLIGYNGTGKSEGLTVSKHSNSFNESMSNAMTSYYALTESFVNWDTAKINSSLAEFKTSVDSLRKNKNRKKILLFIQPFKVSGN